MHYFGVANIYIIGKDFMENFTKNSANHDVRERAQRCGSPLWKVADACAISEATLTRWLRHELSGERLKRVEAALTALEAERGAGR